MSDESSFNIGHVTIRPGHLEIGRCSGRNNYESAIDAFEVAVAVTSVAAATTVVGASVAVEAVALGVLLVIVLLPGRLNALAASFILSA